VSTTSTNKSRGNPAIAAKLRARIERTSVFAVANEMQIGREAIARYVSGLPMNTSTVRGIEASLGHLPETLPKANGRSAKANGG
jgi:hypothetical protein